MINTSATLAASSRDIARTVKSRHAMQEQTLIQFLRQRQERAVKFRRTVTAGAAEYKATVFYRNVDRCPRGFTFRTTDANYAYDPAHLA